MVYVFADNAPTSGPYVSSASKQKKIYIYY